MRIVDGEAQGPRIGGINGRHARTVRRGGGAAALDPESGDEHKEVERPVATDEVRRRTKPDRQFWAVIRKALELVAAGVRRSDGRAVRGRHIVVPLETEPLKRPVGSGIGFSGKEYLLPSARTCDGERTRKDDLVGLVRPVCGERTGQLPRDEHAGDMFTKGRGLRVEWIAPHEEARTWREAGRVPLPRISDNARRAERMHLVGVGKTVAVGVGEGRRVERVEVGVGAVDEAVAVAVAHERIRAACDFLRV